MDLSKITEDEVSANGNIVERAIMRMLFSRSDAVFFAYFLVKMAMTGEPHPRQSLGMGVSQRDGLFSMSYDLDRLVEHKLDDLDTIVWILGHECWHWVLNHSFREVEYWDRNEEMIGKYHTLFNIAGDLEIHEHHPPVANLVDKVCVVGRGPFEDYPKEATMEEYFALLRKDNPEPPQQADPGPGQPGEGQPGEGDDQDGGGGGGGGGDGGQAQSGEGRLKTSVNGTEVTIHDNATGKTYKFRMNMPDAQDPSAGSSLAQEVLRQQLAEAFKEARPSMGTEPGGLASIVEKLIAPPRIDWRHRFRQMVCKHVRFNWQGSWRRFSRRLGEGFRGRVRDHGLRIVVAVDTSGSVGDEELAEFANEIDNMRMVHKVKSLWIVECDAMVQPGGVYELPPGQRISPRFHGRGGTDFRPVFEYVEAAKWKIDMLIYLTDSQGSCPTTKPNYPVIWAVTTQAALSQLPWGDIVFLELDKARTKPRQ